MVAPKKVCLAIFSVASGGFVLSLLSFWPGFMEFDSFDQYGQAIGQSPINDWHPVIMTLLWKGLISIYDGPQPMLIIQLVLYWAGFTYLAKNIWQRTGRTELAIGAVVVPFLPFLLNFSGVLWKDTHLALALFWATLLLVFGRRSTGTVLASLLLIFYGLAVRHNGMAAAFPILLLWGYEFSDFMGFENIYSTPIVAVCFASTLFLINLGISEIVVVEKTSPLNHQMLNEIAFIQCQSNGSGDVIQPYQGEALILVPEPDRQTDLCNQIYSLASNGDTEDIYERKVLQEPDYKDDKLGTIWIQNVSAHPLLYLKYRLMVFRTFLRPFDYSEPYYTFCDGTEINPYPDRFSAEPTNSFGLTTLLTDYVSVTSKKFHIFFRPIFWLMTLLFTISLSLVKRNLVASLICLSGVSYIGMYFFFLPAPDFRYAYWAIFAQILSSFLLLAPAKQGSEEGPSPLTSTGVAAPEAELI